MSEHKIPMMRDGLCLKPYGNIAVEDFQRVTTQKPVVVTIDEARNVKQLRKYWTIAQAVADFHDGFTDRYDADLWVRCQMPWMIREIELGNGRFAVRPKSIALESMSQADFSRFMDRALFKWSEKIGCDPEKLLDQTL